MVTYEKPQILNCNILFYFKWIYLQTITFELWDETQFKCSNGLFDLEVFRVWPWPLTFRGHLGSKIAFPPFESPYMTLYLTPIDIFSLSRTEIFSRYTNSKSSGFDLDLSRSPDVKNIFTIRKPIHDSLSDLFWQFLSISYRFWDIRLTFLIFPCEYYWLAGSLAVK